MENERYKSCFIPSCKSSTITTPQKEFIRLPSTQKEVLTVWNKFAKHSTKKLPKRFVFCCKDHLDILFDAHSYCSSDNIILGKHHYGLSKELFEHLCSVQVLLDKCIVDNYLKTKNLVPIELENRDFSYQNSYSSYENSDKNQRQLTRLRNEYPVGDLEHSINFCELIHSSLEEQSICYKDSKENVFNLSVETQSKLRGETQFMNSNDIDYDCENNRNLFDNEEIIMETEVENSKYFICSSEGVQVPEPVIKSESVLESDEIFNEQIVISTIKNEISDLNSSAHSLIVLSDTYQEEIDEENSEVAELIKIEIKEEKTEKYTELRVNNDLIEDEEAEEEEEEEDDEGDDEEVEDKAEKIKKEVEEEEEVKEEDDEGDDEDEEEGEEEDEDEEGEEEEIKKEEKDTDKKVEKVEVEEKEKDEEIEKKRDQMNFFDICQKCGKLFLNLTNLKKHEILCSENFYNCDFCKKTFPRLYYLKIHFKKMHGVSEEVAENICERIKLQREQAKAKARKSVLQKMRAMSYKSQKIAVDERHKLRFRKLYCFSCEKSFDASSYENNKGYSMLCPTCGSESAYECEKCKKIFYRKTTFRHHLINVCFKKIYFACTDCNYRSKSLSNLLKHRETGICKEKSKKLLKLAKFRCDSCDYETFDKLELDEHRISEHTIMSKTSHLSENEDSSSGKSMVVVNETPIEKSLVAEDRLQFSKDEVWQCSNCKKSYKLFAFFKSHEAICLVKYRCTHCSEIFDNHTDVRNHLYEFHRRDIPEHEMYSAYLKIIRKRQDIQDKMRMERKERQTGCYQREIVIQGVKKA